MAHLYVMQRSDAPGVWKVGRSDDPQRRAVDLQTGHCFLVHVVATFHGAGCCERAVHELLAEHRVDGGTGREWFRTSLLNVYQAIAQGSADDRLAPIVAPTDGPLTPANLGSYIQLTDLVQGASTCAEIRRGLATVFGMDVAQVAACLQAAGLEEVSQHYTSEDGVKTPRRVYKNNGMFAVLVRQ